MTVAFHTLGCKLNQAETEALAEAFTQAGFVIARPLDNADIVVVNSCTVTGRSDSKSRHSLRQAASRFPEALVILTGCYAEVERATLQAAFEKQLMAVVPQSLKARLKGFAVAAAATAGFASFSRKEKFDLFQSYLDRPGSAQADPFDLLAGAYFFHTRAFLKIQDGCDCRCAYCRVPLARGRSISLDFDLVLEQLRRIIERDVREVVLTGVNISAYSSGGRVLADLMEAAVRCTRHVRFRLSSLEPEALTPRLFSVLAHPAVCPHFHIPLQSGSADVLARMRRRYGPDALRSGLASLRRTRPDAFIAADVIVGFPGETDTEFGETMSLLSELSVNGLHVFPFSPRPGTTAWSLPAKVPAAVVRERMRLLLDLGNDLSNRYLSEWNGKSVEVILEKTAAGGWVGSSGHSIKCLVEGMPRGEAQSGRLVTAIVSAPGRPCRVEWRGFQDEKPVYLPASNSELLAH
jgi:threonylcarbamoyladenosine tRNA methylthiotransferase MtaB